MKKSLILGVFAMLAAGTSVMAQPGMERSAEARLDRALAASVGQPVYDLRDMQIGVIHRYVDDNGQPSVIVTAFEGGPGNHQVIISDEAIEPRDAGGWLADLSSNSIRSPKPYMPGEMSPPA